MFYYYRAKGVYYLVTNDKPPFAAGYLKNNIIGKNEVFYLVNFEN